LNSESHCFLAALEQEALLQIAGPDGSKFLQGQTTCDLRKLSPERALLGAFCTPQGRMVCDFLLCQPAPEQLLLRMRRGILEASAAAFGKYIVFSRAQLSTEQTQWQLLGCWGDDAEAALAAVFPSVPAHSLDATSGPGFVLVRVESERFEIYLHGEAGQRFAQSLRALSVAMTAARWRALEIHSGLGRIEAETIEMFIPQMLNYDLSGHVSFDKGCYTGQEVVARMHYRGKSKRRLYSARVAAARPPQPGTAIFSGSSEQSVGNVVNSVCKDTEVTEMLAVLATAALDGDLHLATIDGPLLRTGEHPYQAKPD
jgi:folate-binding protein YgfZ